MTVQRPDFPGFELVARISNHAHADVYHAVHLTSAKSYALKLAKTPLGASHIEKEVSLLTQFAGIDGVVICTDSGLLEDMPYLLMPFYQGTLHQHILARQAPVNCKEALMIMARLVQVVSTIHQQGVIHCDLHPQNILTDENGKWCIADFAAAVHSEKENFQSVQKVRAGTPLYASPEQILGLAQLSVAADTYALTSIFCALVSGNLQQNILSPKQMQELRQGMSVKAQRDLFEKIDGAHKHWLSSQQIKQNHSLSSVLSKGLARDPNERYHSSEELFSALKGACTDADESLDKNDHDHSPHATIAFSHSAQFSSDIAVIKQSIVAVLRSEGSVSDDTINALIERYHLNDKISKPELVLADLIKEAETFLAEDNEHVAFLHWIHTLREFASRYGTQLTKKQARRFVQHGVAAGAGKHANLAAWLLRHFVVQSWWKANAPLIAALGFVIALLVFVWYPNNPIIYNKSDESVERTIKPLSIPDMQSGEATQGSNPTSSLGPQAQGGQEPAVKPFVRKDAHEQLVYTVSDVKTQQSYTLRFESVAVTNMRATIGAETFYVMSEEVSQGLWQACVNAGKCRQVITISTNADRKQLLALNHPAVNVSWYDVTEDFIPYLNATLGEQFALPTMAQWLNFAYSSQGQPLRASYIHCKDCALLIEDYENTTMPVSAAQAGPNGLFHVYGNAQEWLQDCWQDVKLGLQRCDQAAAVGGSWMDTKQSIEQQPLARLLKTARSITTGFRLVKRETSL